MLVDFDRTLFDTERFVGVLWKTLGAHYGVDGMKELSRVQDFYYERGTVPLGYDFFSHLAAIKSIKDSETTVEAILRNSLRSEDFLFEDARSLYDDIDEIVTLGDRKYQTFKLSICPDLVGIRTHIIQESKAGFIKRQYLRPTLLVDDKHHEHELPESCNFILINREQQDEIVNHGNYHSVRSLKYVTSLRG